MRYTSAEAAKMLRKLNDEREALLDKERRSSVFLAAVGEDAESVRPAYTYADTQTMLDKLDAQIRVVKHAINRFNTTQVIPGFDMTIDQMLIYIPQLTAKKRKLGEMKNRLPKQRENADRFGRTNSIIDYSYANYDIGEVERDYEKVSEELARAQTALDVINNVETMEIE